LNDITESEFVNVEHSSKKNLQPAKAITDPNFIGLGRLKGKKRVFSVGCSCGGLCFVFGDVVGIVGTYRAQTYVCSFYFIFVIVIKNAKRIFLQRR
jgi:hypothetical protein